MSFHGSVFAKLAPVALSALLLTACGGGGGGTTLDSGVSYSGNRSQATVSEQNTQPLLSTLVAIGSSGQTVSPFRAGAFEPAGMTIEQQAGLIADTARRAAEAARLQPKSASRAQSVDETIPCDSGNMRLSGQLNDAGTGSITVSYNACGSDGFTINGSMTLSITAVNEEGGPAAMTMTFNRLTMVGPGVESALGGTVSLMDGASGSTTVIDLAAYDGIEEAYFLSDGLTEVYSTDGSTTIAGTVCHSAHGCVTITTESPIFIDDVTGYPTAGIIILTGAGTASVRVLYANPDATSVTAQVDENGDGIYELDLIYDWAEIGG